MHKCFGFTASTLSDTIIIHLTISQKIPELPILSGVTMEVLELYCLNVS